MSLYMYQCIVYDAMYFFPACHEVQMWLGLYYLYIIWYAVQYLDDVHSCEKSWERMMNHGSSCPAEGSNWTIPHKRCLLDRYIYTYIYISWRLS